MIKLLVLLSTKSKSNKLLIKTCWIYDNIKDKPAVHLNSCFIHQYSPWPWIDKKFDVKQVVTKPAAVIPLPPWEILPQKIRKVWQFDYCLNSSWPSPIQKDIRTYIQDSKYLSLHLCSENKSFRLVVSSIPWRIHTLAVSTCSRARCTHTALASDFIIQVLPFRIALGHCATLANEMDV